MELRPGTYFEMDGKGFEYVGVQKSSDESQDIKVVAKIDSTEKDAALHHVFSLQDLEERGSDFWIFGEALRYPEFTRQYQDRITSLRKTGVLRRLSSGEEGVIGSDGDEYPVPTFARIRGHILENSSKLSVKIEQGFTRLHLTPITAPLYNLATCVRETILEHTRQEKIFEQKPDHTSPDVSARRINSIDPLFGLRDLLSEEASETLVYFPSSFNENKDNSLTKSQVRTDQKYCLVPGWSVSLIEEDPFLPRQGKGQVLGGRPQLENNFSAYEYHELLSNDVYSHETGFTLEDMLIDFLTRLEETNQISYDEIDYNQVLLLGSYSKKFQLVSYGLWDHRSQRLVLEEINPHTSGKRIGTRTAVRLGT